MKRVKRPLKLSR